MLNTIIHDKCENVLPKIKKEYDISLILTDPPYNIKFNRYEDGKDKGYKDNLSSEEYVNLMKQLKGTPSAIIHYPEEMMKYVVPALGVPDEVLAWCYPSNINRRFRLINIYGKNPDFTRVLQPYKNPTDRRVRQLIANGSKGTPLYDWFTDINIVKNVSQEKSEHPCPVPVDLMKRIIILLTNKGDIVVDPFMGSGTTAIACKMLNRNYIGIELSKKYVELSEKRIKKYEIENIDIFDKDEL